MIPSPLRLDHCFPTKIFYEARADGDLKATFDIRTQVTGAVAEENNRKWMIVLEIVLSPSENETPGYVLSAEYTGFFTVDKNYPKERVETLVHVNGPALLYSAAREMLTLLTARGPWPKVSLPSVIFIDAAQDVEEKKPTRRGRSPARAMAKK